MKRFSPYALVQEVVAGDRRTMTGNQFLEIAGWSHLAQLQAATGIPDKQLTRALDEDNVVVTVVPWLPTDAVPPVASLRSARDVPLASWSAKLVRPVRPICRRRPAHVVA